MVEYTKVTVRLSDSKLKKLQDAVSNNTGTTLEKNYSQKTKNKNKKCVQ